MDPVEQPWSDEQARWVIRRAATLSLCGTEPVGPFVYPDGRFFPDTFDKAPDRLASSVGKVFERLKEHVGLAEVDTELLFIDPDDGRVVSSCSSGGCSAPGVKTLDLAGQGNERVGGGDGAPYTVRIATTEIGHPTVMTTVLSRALGQVFLREVDALARFPRSERAGAADLAASMIGLGVLIANGSAIQIKGCGGMKTHSATALTAPVAALALALACEREAARSSHTAPGLALIDKQLDPSARLLFGLARELMRENRDVVRRLDHGADGLDQGAFSLRKPGGSIGARLLRALGLKKPRELDPLEQLELEAAIAGDAPRLGAATGAAAGSKADRADDRKRAKLAEIRALVDESFE